MSLLLWFGVAATGDATASPEGVFATAAVGTVTATGTPQVVVAGVGFGVGPRRRERPFPQSVDVRVVGVSARARVGRATAIGQRQATAVVQGVAASADVAPLTIASVSRDITPIVRAVQAQTAVVQFRADAHAACVPIGRARAVVAPVVARASISTRLRGAVSIAHAGSVIAMGTRWPTVIAEDDEALLLGLVA